MRIILTQQESLDFFYNALCNAVGTGYMSSYGLRLDYEDQDYKEARDKLKIEGNSVCMEDIWKQILLDGKKLTMEDIEGDGENTRSIGIKEVWRRVKRTPIKHLVDMHMEQDDATTADAIIQTVFWNEIIFG